MFSLSYTTFYSHLFPMSGTVTIGKVRLADEFLSHQIDSIEAEQSLMSARVTTVEDEVAVVKANADASSATAVSDRVTTVEQDVTATGQDISAVSTRVTAVEQDMTAAESDISALETDWNSFKSVADVSGGGGLTVKRSDGLDTVLSTSSSNYIRGTTSFRVLNETNSRAYISSGGFYARATDQTGYQVGDKLQELEGRISALESRTTDVETYYVDTRKIYKFRNHVANKYINSAGDVASNADSIHAHYSIERD